MEPGWHRRPRGCPSPEPLHILGTPTAPRSSSVGQQTIRLRGGCRPSSTRTGPGTRRSMPTDAPRAVGSSHLDGTRIVLGGGAELEPAHYFPSGARDLRGASIRWWRRFRSGSRPGMQRIRAIPPTERRSSSKGAGARQAQCFPTLPPAAARSRAQRAPIASANSMSFVLGGERRRYRPASNRPIWPACTNAELVAGRTVDLVHRTGAGVILVHPDGTRRLVCASRWRPFRGCVRAYYPSWSPDGTRFVFVGLWAPMGFNLSRRGQMASDVEQIDQAHGIAYRGPLGERTPVDRAISLRGPWRGWKRYDLPVGIGGGRLNANGGASADRELFRNARADRELFRNAGGRGATVWHTVFGRWERAVKDRCLHGESDGRFAPGDPGKPVANECPHWPPNASRINACSGPHSRRRRSSTPPPAIPERPLTETRDASVLMSPNGKRLPESIHNHERGSNCPFVGMGVLTESRPTRGQG